PGATYTVSAWIIREASPCDPALVRVVFVDADGAALETSDLNFGTTSSQYLYREGRVIPPPAAVAMDPFRGVLLETGSVLFDDVQEEVHGDGRGRWDDASLA